MESGKLGYAVGEYVAGAITGIAAALPIHALVDPRWDLVLAMMVGAGVGMLAHFSVALLAAPWVGMFPVMVPGALIGMYGGMFFGMRDSMQAASWGQAVSVAALFGLAVVAGVRCYDRSLRFGATPPTA